MIVIINSCDFSSRNNENGFGKLQLNISHSIKADTFNYINEAGNKFMISEIQYFISDIKLYGKKGDTIILDKYNDIHYIDTDIPETFVYFPVDSVKPGVYDKMSFTFGINEKKNKSRLFVNPPESFMFWPEFLGGGYHYMKLNGKWLDSLNQPKVFNFHLGIGQNYDEDRNVVGFVQNYFEVSLENSSVEIKPSEIAQVDIVMQVENWFRSPNIWDFNKYGGKIMQNQKAISLACENGHDIFLIKSVKYKDLN
ncbi:MAG: hypothetical protein C0595_06710 [Marinilabiliales bacterium]|nr:MAG: hypothetical protein C0595_06710 [Marinilabiliales bacterium]